MPLKLAQRAPYATAKTVISVLEKHRAVGLTKIDSALLARIGVSESLIPRTLASLALLDFTDEDGTVTAEFRRLPNLTDDEFKQAIADLLRTAYAPVLEVIGDPSEAAVKDVENAFRGFTPTGQIDRMVQLFIGLMVYVDLMPEQGRRKASGTAKAPARKVAQPTPRRATVPVKDTSALPAASQDDPNHNQRESAAAATHSQSVRLASGGGSVTLSYDVNLFELDDADEAFLLGLIKSLKGYQKVAPLPDRLSGGGES